MAGFSFSDMPKINVNRSIFKRSMSHKTTINTGDLVPVYWEPVLPGDTVQMKVSQLIRSLTVSAPVMDNAFITIAGFFVPYLAIWSGTKEFFCEGQNFGSSLPNKTIPSIGIADLPKSGAWKGWPAGTIGNYLGLPDLSNNPYTANGSFQGMLGRSISELPLRAYVDIYEEYWRDENYQPAQPIDTGDQPQSNASYRYSRAPLKANKFHDYFTSVLPEPQKGEPVTFGITGVADVVSKGGTVGLNAVKLNGPGFDFSSSDLPDQTTAAGAPVFGHSASSSWTGGWNDVGTKNEDGSFADIKAIQGGSGSSLGWFSGEALGTADLSTATAISVNDFRFAVQLQRFLEKNARYGTRYSEFIYGHFGVHDPALEEQIPKALWKVTLPLSMETVVANSGGGDTVLGDMAGYSKTGNVTDNYVNSFTQYGIYMIVATIRTYQTYSGGIGKKFTRLSLLDQYFPVFDHLGEQPVGTYEINLKAALDGASYSAGGTLDKDTPIFGFQEAFADMRYSPNLVTGLLAPSADGSLDMWTYAIDPADIPETCNNSFLRQSKDEVARTLSYQDTFQWLADFYFDTKWSRPMLVHSIPGLVDHD